MNEPVDLQSMDEAQMRQMLQHLMSELKHKQTLLDKLSYEMAILKRLKFAAKTEALNADQRSLLEDALEEDLQGVRPQRPKGSTTGCESTLERPESRRSCRHLKTRASALVATSVVQTFPNDRLGMNDPLGPCRQVRESLGQASSHLFCQVENRCYQRSVLSFATTDEVDVGGHCCIQNLQLHKTRIWNIGCLGNDA